MPSKERKRFKAITEEVKPNQEPELIHEVKEPEPSLPVEETRSPRPRAEKEDIKHQEEAAKLIETLGVAETNNIAPSGPKTASRRNSLLFIGIMFLVALIVMALAGGVWVYLNGVKNLTYPTQVETSVPSAAPVATPVASPTSSNSATPKPDYSLFNVSVLNGSGAIGAATAVRDIIQKGGFKVSYTGNAANFNFTDTLIQVKNTVSADVVAALRSLLVPTYSVKIGTQLDSQSRYDIIITVGSK